MIIISVGVFLVVCFCENEVEVVSCEFEDKNKGKNNDEDEMLICFICESIYLSIYIPIHLSFFKLLGVYSRSRSGLRRSKILEGKLGEVRCVR